MSKSTATANKPASPKKSNTSNKGADKAPAKQPAVKQEPENKAPDVANQQQEIPEKKSPANEEKQKSPARAKGVTVQLPELLAPPKAFYKTSHVELRCNRDQALKVSALYYSLMHAGIEVRSPPDAVKWLLDQLPILEPSQN